VLTSTSLLIGKELSARHQSLAVLTVDATVSLIRHVSPCGETIDFDETFYPNHCLPQNSVKIHAHVQFPDSWLDRSNSLAPFRRFGSVTICGCSNAKTDHAKLLLSQCKGWLCADGHWDVDTRALPTGYARTTSSTARSGLKSLSAAGDTCAGE
jgi:hypothetical protein